MLKEGQAAPAFVLPDADLEMVDLSQYLGKTKLILFFYPKDGSPHCTLEVTDFSDHEDEFSRLGCTVIGINRDDCFRHADFRDEHGIAIRLLSDTEGTVCKQYGVWQMKEVDGVKRHCIVRSTFVIDNQGVLRHVLYGVNAKGHVREILHTVKELH
ncbi:MAG: peroxiredoxin [Zoogloeaceae bacterium]|nr:peroxiredoxin [Zoogloeaceae bacterium]